MNKHFPVFDDLIISQNRFDLTNDLFLFDALDSIGIKVFIGALTLKLWFCF